MSDAQGWLRDELRALRDEVGDAREVLARIDQRLTGHEESSARHRAVVETMDTRVKALEHDRSRLMGVVGGLGLGSTAFGAWLMRTFGWVQ